MATFLARELGYKRERILAWAVAYGHLRARWFVEDGLDPEPSLRVARALARK